LREIQSVIVVSLSDAGYICQVPNARDDDKFNDGMYEDLCVDDADLTFEDYEELFGTSHIRTEELFDDAGIDGYFELKETPPFYFNEVCTSLV
jgi:hypothetical protein